MKRIAPAIALSAMCSIAAAASLPAHATSTGAPPCQPKKATINGKPVFELCGPATATVRVGGKTYSFRGGYCEIKKGTTSLDLFLGTLPASAKGNAGRPLFNMTAEHFGGTVLNAGGTVGASYGGKQLVNGLTSVAGHFPNQGSFKSITKSITGTWNCHGLIYHAP